MPLKLAKQYHNDQAPQSIWYEIDNGLLEEVENLERHGYKAVQPKVMDWLQLECSKNAVASGYGGPANLTSEYGHELLRNWMLVKEDKPNSCYHYDKLLENLSQMPAETFAEAIRGSPNELNCTTAFELLW